MHLIVLQIKFKENYRQCPKWMCLHLQWPMFKMYKSLANEPSKISAICMFLVSGWGNHIPTNCKNFNYLIINNLLICTRECVIFMDTFLFCSTWFYLLIGRIMLTIVFLFMHRRMLKFYFNFFYLHLSPVKTKQSHLSSSYRSYI